MKKEYQKYKQKYIIYKFKYHEFKKTTKLFLSYMKMIPPGSSISSFLDNFNENKTFNLLGAKRLKSYTDKEELKNSDNINNIKAIRNIHINSQLRKKSEETFKDIFKMPSLFNNTDDYDYNDYNDNVDKNESEEKNRNNKESSKKRRKKNEKKNLIKIKEEDSDSNKSENEISIEEKEKEKKKETKKRGRRPKKLVKKTKVENDSDEEEKKSPKKKSRKKKENKENKESKESNDKEKNEKEEKKKDKSETPQKDKIEENKDKKEKEIKEEKEEEKEKEKEEKEKEEKEKEKVKEEHIGPIPKNIKKKLDPMEQKVLNTNNLLNLLSNTPDNINEESLNSILSLQNTIQEKTSFLFEIIVPNIIKLELSRVLSLFETFIEMNQDSKSIIGINILENIHLNLNSNNLLNKKNHLKITNKTNETYQNYINKNFSQSIYIISFLIDILYRKLIDVSCVSNFLYQLLFDKNIDNKNKSSILIILTNTIKEKKEKMNTDDDDISNKKLFLKEEQLIKYLSTENENKFYFFLSFKNNLVSENIVNLIISIYDKHNKNESNSTFDTEIINHFNKLLDKIPNDKELKVEVPKFLEEYKSSVKFNTDIFYLEIFQALNIIVEIKEMKWIYENIFTNILWKCFQNSKKDSLKRALSIYYSSLLFYLCLKNGIKNHTNENLLEQQEFSRLYAWLYSIYNTQPQFESSIGFYERLCALSWIVESPIVTMSEKVVDTIKQVVNNKVKGENESLCPTDFLDKLRKLNIL